MPATAMQLTPEQREELEWWLVANWDERDDTDELAAEAACELFSCPDDTEEATALIDAVTTVVEEWSR